MEVGKLRELLEQTDDKLSIFKTLDTETLRKTLVEHKEFYKESRINPYEVISMLDLEQQKEFIINLEKMNLTLNEKKEILATLQPDVKQSIDTTKFPEEYKIALSMQTKEHSGQIILDLERNLDDDQGLDNLIRVNPEEFNETQKAKFMKLCDICPEMKVESTIGIVPYTSSVREYKESNK